MWDLTGTEDKIIDAINHLRIIKGKRPSSQEIFDLLNDADGEGKGKLELSLFKDALLNLQNNGKIYNGGSDSKESYYVIMINKSEAEEKTVDEGVSNESATENIFNFIDESFDKILYARIKSQVKQELEVLLSDENLLSINLKLNKDAKYNDSNDHRLITTLQSEVDFLRNEILTKNKIIETILVDNRNDNVINENLSKHLNGDDRNHDTRKKSIRSKKRDQINSNTIQLNNRFSLLDDETNLRINDGNINTSQSTPINVECSMEKLDANDENQSNHQDGNRERKARKNRNITILGDSILKDIKPYKMREVMKSKDEIFIKSFPLRNV